MCYLSCLPCHAWTGVGRCCVGVQASPAPAPVAHWLLTLLVLELSSPMGTSAFQWAVWAPHISRSCSRCLKRGCRPPSNCGGRRQLPARRELRCSERLHAVGQSTDAEAGCASNNNGAEPAAPATAAASAATGRAAARCGKAHGPSREGGPVGAGGRGGVALRDDGATLLLGFTPAKAHHAGLTTKAGADMPPLPACGPQPCAGQMLLRCGLGMHPSAGSVPSRRGVAVHVSPACA